MRTENRLNGQMFASLESGADKQINEGVGRENLIDQIVYFTGKAREEYSNLSLYELAVELKIAKLQVGM